MVNGKKFRYSKFGPEAQNIIDPIISLVIVCSCIIQPVDFLFSSIRNDEFFFMNLLLG